MAASASYTHGRCTHRRYIKHGSHSYLGTVTNLTVTGTIDARDFKTMRDNMPLLAVLDLSGVTIAAYTGPDGTHPSGGLYPENEIPGRAFYKKQA